MAKTQTTTSSNINSIALQTVDTKSSKSSPILSGPVTAILNFYSPPNDDSRPYNYVETPPTGFPQRNYSHSLHPIIINDIRTSPAIFSLDKNAFLPLFSLPPSKADFTSASSIQEIYYPEIQSLLLTSLPGTPHRILIFNHTVRRSFPPGLEAPVQKVHIDQTPTSARVRVHQNIPDKSEAEALLKSRVRVINVWRPLNGPVESFPLGFADSASVPDDALVAIEQRLPDRTFETTAVRWTEGQRWRYWSAMRNDEGLLLQCFDSEGGGRVPHSAFVDPRSGPDAKGRESIEVRALVFG